MGVTEHDRRYMQRVARDLAAIECDDEPDAETLRGAIERANRARRAQGRPDLADEEEHPESELYRRARALGLR